MFYRHFLSYLFFKLIIFWRISEIGIKFDKYKEISLSLGKEIFMNRDILILSLKRFKFGRKINTYLSFPEILDLYNYSLNYSTKKKNKSWTHF